MRIPKIIGIIDRRILINYQVDKDVVAKFLPEPFRPKLVNNKAIVGICLIRLKDIRPKGVPKMIGISSENGAHRIAVEWTDKDGVREGVYIPRRDTSSKLNSLAGGRFFPGVHHFAEFTVDERDGNYSVEFKSDDNTTYLLKLMKPRTGTPIAYLTIWMVPHASLRKEQLDIHRIPGGIHLMDWSSKLINGRLHL